MKLRGRGHKQTNAQEAHLSSPSEVITMLNRTEDCPKSFVLYMMTWDIFLPNCPKQPFLMAGLVSSGFSQSSLQNKVLVGYTVFSMSVILHLMFLLYNFNRLCPFWSNLHHTLAIRQCSYGRKIGAEGSVLQELCLFVILTIRWLYYDW